jgi:hypothetical protein
LTQIILDKSGFKFIQMKESVLLQGEIIAKEYTETFKKNSSAEPAGKIQFNLVHIILG